MTNIPQTDLGMVDFEVDAPSYITVAINGQEVNHISRKIKFRADGTIEPDYRGWTRWRLEIGRIISYAPGGGGECLSGNSVVEAYKRALSDKIGRELME